LCVKIYFFIQKEEGGDEKERKSDGKCKVYEKDGTFTLVQESLIVL
jgi:hypothetical protein